MIRKLKNFAHLLIAITANILYGFPSRNMYVIGVTGTDGKTTTTSIIYHILKEAGKKVSVITTLGAEIGGKKFETGFHTTTPSAFFLQRYIKKAKDTRSNYLVLEVTSHGLDQNRGWGIPFQIGVLTNITHEHLDYHKTYEKYVTAKSKLFKRVITAIINKDDESYDIVRSKLKSQNSKVQPKKIITYGLTKKSDINPENFSFKTQLIGKFNLQNCLAAISVAKELGIEESIIKKALLSFAVPEGRQEVVHDGTFKVVVDFAHTPNSFKKVLPELKAFNSGRLIHVFGAASKRDTSKRPLMGAASAQYADVIILTAEDPRGESVEKINEEILSGIQGSSHKIQGRDKKIEKKGKYIISIPDRKEAISFALAIAEKGDIVVMTGKGHEKSMNYGNGEIPWSDKEVALQILSENKVIKE